MERLINNTSKRYSILRHTNHPDKPDHFDLVLERTSGEDLEELVLDKFEIFEDKISEINCIIYFRTIRRKYLAYEGPMKNNRGSVEQIGSGKYSILNNTIEFNGGPLEGSYELKIQTDTQFEKSKQYELKVIKRG